MNNNFLPNFNDEHKDNDSNLKNNNVSPESLNHYRDYLPENRMKSGFNIPPKLLKFELGVFWVAIVCVIVLVGVKYFYGIDVLEVKSRNYNLNLSESLNLDSIYSSSDVIWEADNDNVLIKNNVVFATKTGSAYILGRIGDKQVSDVKINVLASDTALSLENHSVSLSVGESVQIKTNSLVDNSNLSGSSTSSFSEFSDGTIDDSNEVDDYDYDSDNSDEFVVGNYEYDDSFDNSSNNSVDDDSGNDTILDTKSDLEDNTVDEDNSGNDDEANDNEEIDGDTIIDAKDNQNDLEYKSSDDSVAKVDDEGNITPVSPGTAIITVKDKDGNQDHTYVTVEDDDLNFYNSEYVLNEKDELQVEYSIKGEKYQKSDIVWSSSVSDICRVDSSGKIFGVSSGTAVITVKLGDNITKTVNVKVIKNIVLPTSLSVSTNAITLFVGDSEKINSSVLPENSFDNTVSYVSSNSNIASVDEKGNVVGKGVGVATITVSTVNNLKQTVQVTVNKKTIPVNKIYFSESSISLEVNEVTKLSYVIEPANASDKTVKFNYDKNMVSIDNNGNLKALKSGKTNVEIVSSNEIKSLLELNITSKADIEVGQIILSKDTFNLEVGETSKVSYTISPSDATNKKVTYLYDSSIISIDKSGVIKALHEGKTTIQLKASNGVVSNVANVVVTPPKEVIESLSIKGGNITISTGNTKQLYVTVKGKNIQSSKVWSSSNASVLSINANGVVSAKKEGQATVSVKMGNVSATITVKVIKSKVKVSSISVNKATTTIKMGSTEKLTVSVKPNDATNKNVTWASSNSKIVKVSSNGTITGISKGEAVISVYSNDDKKIKATTKVNVMSAQINSKSKLSNLENAKSYKEEKVLKNLTYKDLTYELTVYADEGVRTGQSFTATDKYYITATINTQKTKIKVFDRKTKKLLKTFTEQFGHANGMTSNPKTKMVYVTNVPYSFSYNNITKLDKLTVKKIPNILENKGLAYDSTTNQFYLSRNSNVYVYNSKFELIKRFKKIRNTSQDCEAFKGLLLCAHFESLKATPNGRIDIYRISDSAYVGTINIDFKGKGITSLEIESIAHLEGNEFALYYNLVDSKSKKAAFIYTTTEFPIY